MAYGAGDTLILVELMDDCETTKPWTSNCAKQLSYQWTMKIELIAFFFTPK